MRAVRACVQARGHAVVVVAEGAGEDEMCAEMSARGKVVERDAGGNRKLPPVGEWLQAKVAAHFDAAGTPAEANADLVASEQGSPKNSNPTIGTGRPRSSTATPT